MDNMGISGETLTQEGNMWMGEKKKQTNTKNTDAVKAERPAGNQSEAERLGQGGYYVRQPSLGKGRGSWLKQQFGRSIAMFLAVAACILLYFALLRASQISAAVSNADRRGKADYIRTGDRVSVKSLSLIHI